MNPRTQRGTIGPEVLLPLQEAIKLLPNVRLAVVRDQLGDAAQGSFTQDLLAVIRDFNCSGDGSMVVPSESLGVVVTSAKMRRNRLTRRA